MNAPRISLLAVAGISALWIAASGGVAAEQNKDRTGAPGSSAVCTNCHNGGTVAASAAFEVLDMATELQATSYLPGQEYILRMVINGGTSNHSYGAQGTAVLDNGENAGAFSNPAGNTQLEDVGGRHIFEHNNPSAANAFEVTWTAPESGSGPAHFYMSGLVVNGNNATSGDAYTNATLTLPESTSDLQAADEPRTEAPSRVTGEWRWVAPAAGRLVVADVSGRTLLARNLAAGQPVTWPLNGTLNVVSFATEGGASTSWKLAPTR